MTSCVPHLRTAGLLCAIALACWPGAAAAQEPAPSLKLFAADTSVRTTERAMRCCPALGLWITATGGDFRIDLRRPGYGRWQATQVDARTGAPLRSIPAGLIAGGRGLEDLVTLRYFDTRGRPVGRQTVTLCPGGFDVERVNDEGPPLPGLSAACSGGFPFTLGLVWGLSRGWAAPVRIEPGASISDIPRRVWRRLPRRLRERLRRLARRQAPPVRLEPGAYRVVAEIGEPHRRLFAIPPEDAAVTLRLRVVRAKRRGRPHHSASSARASAGSPLAAQAVEEPPASTRPDLAALPPWALRTSHRGRSGRDVLTFASSPWNAGPAPLVVEGFRRRGRAVMDAYQYFFDADGEVVGRAAAGAMAFHSAPRHNHWHFLQLVSYRLLRPDGRTAARSRKQAFCITATDPVDLTLPRAEVNQGFPSIGGSSCGSPGSIWIREALPAGWADTYGAGIPGQSVDITRVPNGRYLMEMHVNPSGDLLEVTTENNIARRRLRLSGKPGRRRVHVAPWNGIRR
jgi:hypothetical protein